MCAAAAAADEASAACPTGTGGGETRALPAAKTEEEKRAARAARFAADEARGPPPLPVRKFAWEGGKLSSNKDEATRRFLARNQKDDDEATELYVGNLSYRTKADAVAEFLGGKSARVVRDKGKSKGFGFAQFDSLTLALAALKLDGAELDGRKLTIRPAKAKSRHATAKTAPPADEEPPAKAPAPAADDTPSPAAKDKVASQ